MSQKNNGGPAFPGPDQAEQRVNIHEGMTLRDYFAVKALQSLITGRNWEGVNGEQLIDVWANGAYSCADAMIRARDAS